MLTSCKSNINGTFIDQYSWVIFKITWQVYYVICLRIMCSCTCSGSRDSGRTVSGIFFSFIFSAFIAVHFLLTFMFFSLFLFPGEKGAIPFFSFFFSLT